jgi:hypothetical protein
MREVIPFCMEHDPSPPDIVELLYREKKFREKPTDSEGFD